MKLVLYWFKDVTLFFFSLFTAFGRTVQASNPRPKSHLLTRKNSFGAAVRWFVYNLHNNNIANVFTHLIDACQILKLFTFASKVNEIGITVHNMRFYRS